MKHTLLYFLNYKNLRLWMLFVKVKLEVVFFSKVKLREPYD